jgi:UDP-N-acetylglucosamine acyltransferase
MSIHPTAIISPGAKLGVGVTVGAYAYVGPEVTLGDGCVLHHHATVEGYTFLGARNEVFPYALVGGKTHDLKYKGGRPGLRVGDDNVFREYATVHLGTDDGEFTTLGSHNHILAYSHVAHGCVIGDHLVMSSHAAIAGHCVIGDHVNVGWNAGIHQFCRVGDHAMVAACSKVVQDVIPFMIADGNPAEVKTLNKVGLERNGFTAEEIDAVRRVHRTLYRDGLNRTQALEKITADAELSGNVRVRQLLGFIHDSKRGLA